MRAIFRQLLTYLARWMILEVVAVELHPSEVQTLRARAATRGLTLPQYLRARALEPEPESDLELEPTVAADVVTLALPTPALPDPAYVSSAPPSRQGHPCRFHLPQAPKGYTLLTCAGTCSEPQRSGLPCDFQAERAASCVYARVKPRT